ncbi:MAG: TIGR04282 family arsenosugar biosynthesis glycosyltransferase, partial [Candidatus Latescibacterota bacterium]
MEPTEDSGRADTRQLRCRRSAGSTCALLFARYPEPGKVKTRLQSELQAVEIARLCEAFLLDSAALLAGCPAQRRVVCCTPAECQGAMRELLSPVAPLECRAQRGAGLGERLGEALDHEFGRGAGRAIVVGSDIPALPPVHLGAALDLLAERDVVLGPSVDGGYYLVGARAGCHVGLFDGIDWSTPLVLRQTVARLAGRSLGLLPVWYDVDTPADLRLLAGHLQALSLAGEEAAPRTLAVLRRLGLVPGSADRLHSAADASRAAALRSLCG